jgi:hypothetical protein
LRRRQPRQRVAEQLAERAVVSHRRFALHSRLEGVPMKNLLLLILHRLNLYRVYDDGPLHPPTDSGT